LGLLKKVKKSIESNHQIMNQKLHNMEKASELKKIEGEKQCKQIYLQIISDKDKREQLYTNIDIKFECIEGNITEGKYKIQIKAHKQRIDELLNSLNHDNFTCEDLYSLYNI